ncbi:uncharacterized protein LOC123408872 isoform X2 [Hordeum vulgare subsp. vulgare]|uniref:uncharacterized protein LOC123408872 isoform X2 n=1 Tax=Hordeum vulgare subsp. vulgare TaxID=112509 RepID=UPI001D1A5B2F|nr:uncharacterized protein LOC123408872 isoform X2 [Hordeum vulgare subsp. vulgare]
MAVHELHPWTAAGASRHQSLARPTSCPDPAAVRNSTPPWKFRKQSSSSPKNRQPRIERRLFPVNPRHLHVASTPKAPAPPLLCFLERSLLLSALLRACEHARQRHGPPLPRASLRPRPCPLGDESARPAAQAPSGHLLASLELPPVAPPLQRARSSPTCVNRPR